MIPIMVYADSHWDKYTINAPAWFQWMKFRPEMVVGWHPYQQPNIGHYQKLGIYIDTYAIYNPSTIATNHPDWILQDDNGNKLFIPWGCSNGTCPQYAGDLTNKGFRDNQMSGIQALVAAGYQAIYLDDVNLALTVSDGTGKIVPPHQVSADTWAFAFVRFLEEVRHSFPKVLICHNSVWWASAPIEAMDRQIKACDFYNMERGYGDPNLSALDMAHQVQFVGHIHDLGRNVIQMEYSQNPIPPSTATLQDKIHWFRLGYKPGDLMIVQDMFPDAWNPLMDTE